MKKPPAATEKHADETHQHATKHMARQRVSGEGRWAGFLTRFQLIHVPAGEGKATQNQQQTLKPVKTRETRDMCIVSSISSNVPSRLW